MEFNYEKAWFTQALPAWNKIPEKIKTIHRKLSKLSKDLGQNKNDLNIPYTDTMRRLLKSLKTEDLSDLAHAGYYIGCWRPHKSYEVFKNPGASWKVANIIDQELRLRFNLPNNVEIHEGMFRVTYSSRNNWTWEIVGRATDKNFEMIKHALETKNFRNIETFTGLALDLKKFIGDMWDFKPIDKKYLDKYNKYLQEKSVLVTKKRIAENQNRIKKLIKEKKKMEYEIKVKKLLVKKGLNLSNCIYYNHLNEFSFGWYSKLSKIEADAIKKIVENIIKESGISINYKLEMVELEK